MIGTLIHTAVDILLSLGLEEFAKLVVLLFHPWVGILHIIVQLGP